MNIMQSSTLKFLKIIMVLSSFFSKASEQDETTVQTLSFDNVFLASPYKQVLDACMSLCGDLDVWSSLDSSPDVDFKEPVELLAGKLLFIEQAVASMLAKQTYISYEDLEYLLHVLEGIERESAFLKRALSSECKEILGHLFATMKDTLEKRLALF